MNKTIRAALGAALLMASGLAAAETEAERTFRQNMDAANREHARQQAERNREATRDRTHDGRVPIDRNTSVGGAVNPAKDGGSIDVRRSTDFLGGGKR